MKKEKIKQLVDVMQAYVNGKTIQYYQVDLSFKIEHLGELNSSNKWTDVDEDHLVRPDLYDYRIKPDSNYRPFRNGEECWQEMQKHQPFGWIKDKEGVRYIMVTTVDADDMSISGYGDWTLDGIMSCYTFAVGAPFGINENL